MSTLLWGLLAEFENDADLLRAAQAARAEGYHKLEGYAPYPVDGLAETLGSSHTRLPLVVAAGGVIGGLLGFGLQLWINVIDLPLNIGGRPWNSWPAFVPVTFELAVLGAALAAVIGSLAMNGLPLPYHPLFNVQRFQLASRDRFFLSIEATDPLFDPERTRQFLRAVTTLEVNDVPA